MAFISSTFLISYSAPPQNLHIIPVPVSRQYPFSASTGYYGIEFNALDSNEIKESTINAPIIHQNLHLINEIINPRLTTSPLPLGSPNKVIANPTTPPHTPAYFSDYRTNYRLPPARTKTRLPHRKSSPLNFSTKLEIFVHSVFALLISLSPR